MTDVNATMTARVGIQTLTSEGNDARPSLGRLGDLLSQPAGKYYALAKAGRIYHVTTTAGGVALNVDVEGTAQSFVLYNPTSSGTDLVILEGRVARGTTGDIGPGTIYWFGQPFGESGTLPTGTDLTIYNGRIGGAENPARALQAATIPGTDPRRLRVLANLSEELLTSVTAHAVLFDQVDGAIIVPPGAWVGISGEGDAGALPIIQISVTFAVVPV